MPRRVMLLHSLSMTSCSEGSSRNSLCSPISSAGRSALEYGSRRRPNTQGGTCKPFSAPPRGLLHRVSPVRASLRPTTAPMSPACSCKGERLEGERSVFRRRQMHLLKRLHFIRQYAKNRSHALNGGAATAADVQRLPGGQSARVYPHIRQLLPHFHVKHGFERKCYSFGGGGGFRRRQRRRGGRAVRRWGQEIDDGIKKRLHAGVAQRCAQQHCIGGVKGRNTLAAGTLYLGRRCGRGSCGAGRTAAAPVAGGRRC